MTRRIAVFGGSFNPPGVHHRRIVELLARRFDAVKVVPCGPRPDKPVTNDIDPIYRAVMADLTFAGLGPAVEVELFDLEHGTFTRTHELEARYAPEGEVWHVVGTDLVRDGRHGRSLIHSVWAHGPELWEKSSFAVVTRREAKLDPGDLPPRHLLLRVGPSGASAVIRQRCFERRSIRGLVTPEVEAYIERWSLYRGRADLGQMRLQLAEPRLMVVADRRNPAAVALEAGLAGLASGERPNLIVVAGGDGAMLHAIRSHWRDGVLVATAAGSTASARAMGANPVPSGTDLLVVVGSNVSRPLNWRTGANLPIDSVVELRSTDTTGWRPVHGFADGVDLGEVVAMTARLSRIAAAELAFTPDHDLGKKLALTQFPRCDTGTGAGVPAPEKGSGA